MPIGNLVALLVPLPIIKSPVVVIGDRALNAADAVVWPVPPEAIGNVPVVNALVDVAYNAPPEVKDVSPVPPLVVANVPASVIAPLVAVLGVKPVVPALNVVTAELDSVPQVGAALAPPEVNT